MLRRSLLTLYQNTGAPLLASRATAVVRNDEQAEVNFGSSADTRGIRATSALPSETEHPLMRTTVRFGQWTLARWQIQMRANSDQLKH